MGSELRADRTADGRPFRMLVVLDEYPLECPAIEVARNFRGKDIVAVPDELTAIRFAPVHIQADNGPEMISKPVNASGTESGTGALSIDPGSPWRNGTVASVNGRVRDEMPLQLGTLVPELLRPGNLSEPIDPNLFFHRWNACPETPSLRQISAIVCPVDSYERAQAICSSERHFLFPRPSQLTGGRSVPDDSQTIRIRNQAEEQSGTHRNRLGAGVRGARPW